MSATFASKINGLSWVLMHPRATYEMLGLIPQFLNAEDARPSREQFQANYKFGGWRPFKGFMLLPDSNITYRGDPPYQLLAETKLREETIRIYACAWVMIRQADGQFEISRMD